MKKDFVQHLKEQNIHIAEKRWDTEYNDWFNKNYKDLEKVGIIWGA
jgi:hypothetical protein